MLATGSDRPWAALQRSHW